jgi:hypothetical protein
MKFLNLLKLFSIPVFNRPVLASTEKVVTVAILVVRNKCNLQYAILMREKCLVTITKIKAPEANILISRAGNNKFAIVGDVHVENRKLVPVQVKEKLQSVDEKDLYCIV